MRAHHRPLGVIERTRLVEDVIGHDHLADVVQQRAPAHVRELVCGHAEGSREHACQLGRALRVAKRLAVTHLECERPALEGGVVRVREFVGGRS